LNKRYYDAKKKKGILKLVPFGLEIKSIFHPKQSNMDPHLINAHQGRSVYEIVN